MAISQEVESVLSSKSKNTFRPADIVTIIFILFLSFLILLNISSIKHWFSYLCINTGMILYLFILSKFSIDKKINLTTFLRLWYPVAFIVIIFSQLHEIVPAVTMFDHDAILIKLDALIFGIQPSIWLQKYSSAILTEILQYIYSLFYFLPLILGIILVLKRKLELYDFYLFFICYGFFLSYLGYFLVPAIGPRFTLKPLYETSLKGVWFYKSIVNLLNILESLQRDCFPSGHTMMTLMVIHFSYRYEKKLFRIYFPVGMALIFSTIYLRYHYAVDVLGGIFFYLFAFYTSKPLYMLLHKYTGKLFDDSQL